MSEYLFTMLRPADRDDVVQLLRKKQAGRSMTELAEELGVCQSYISQVYSGTRNIGPKLLLALGLTQKTFYQEVRQ